MLQETIYKRKKVGLIKRGYYYIETARAVWDRVQVVSRNNRSVRIFYVVVKRYRKHNKWKTHHLRCVEDIPIRFITVAREYTNR